MVIKYECIHHAFQFIMSIKCDMTIKDELTHHTYFFNVPVQCDMPIKDKHIHHTFIHVNYVSISIRFLNKISVPIIHIMQCYTPRTSSGGENMVPSQFCEYPYNILSLGAFWQRLYFNTI